MKILNKDLHIELSPAKIIQVDKFARTGIFTDDRFFPFTANTMHTNIVFQLKNTDKTLPLDVRDMLLPVYDKQEVDIISANQYVIGYVDVKNEEYYYITNDFCKAAGIEISELLSWIIGIAGTIIIFADIKSNYAPLFLCLLFISAWLINVVIKSLLNKKIENAIDEFMKTLSIV